MAVTFVEVVVYISIYIGLVATTFFALSFLYGERKKVPLYKDKELPSASILIPAYNEEESTARTLESIIQAEYPKNKLEIIFIDDGSKDRTLEIARKYEGKHDGKVVRVLTKLNGGKASALNLGISKASGYIVFSMDADTYVDKESVRRMVRFFKDPKVMCVAPSMIVSNPKTILQRVQHIEYLLGLFLRKAFASINAMSVTPGAFSAYRKEFFDKYGGYDVGNITEDLEVALRIQANHFVIQNCPEAIAYTSVPGKFKSLMNQRKRWYVGLVKNSWDYRKLISRQYGDMGIFVLPIAWISIFFSVFMIGYLVINSFIQTKKEILFLQSINFDFLSLFSFNSFVLERTLFSLATNPVLVFLIMFMIAMGFYIYYATKKIGRNGGLVINLPLYIIFFAMLFGFWWVVSIIYVIFDKKVIWKQ